MSDDFTYDADKHLYTIRGRAVPGITTVLDGTGFYPDKQYYTVACRQRGTAVHQAVFFVDEYAKDAVTLDDVLDVINLDERLQPYISGHLLWKQETGFTPVRHEFPVCSRKLKIACKPDLYGRSRNENRMVELKTWADPPAKCPRSAQIQTAAQSLMTKECLGLDTDSRWVLLLTGESNRPYRMYPCEDPNDYQMVTHLAAVWWEKLNSGIIKWKGETEVEVAE